MNIQRAGGCRFGMVPLLVLAVTANAQTSRSKPEVPEALRISAGETQVLHAQASGAQIYVCTSSSDGKPQWTLKAPDAELRDEQGKVIGHHGAGPSWKHSDGSEVTATATARVDAPEAQAVPWLLLRAVNHVGHGVLARVSRTCSASIRTAGSLRRPCNATAPSRTRKCASPTARTITSTHPRGECAGPGTYRYHEYRDGRGDGRVKSLRPPLISVPAAAGRRRSPARNRRRDW